MDGFPLQDFGASTEAVFEREVCQIIWSHPENRERERGERERERERETQTKSIRHYIILKNPNQPTDLENFF